MELKTDVKKEYLSIRISLSSKEAFKKVAEIRGVSFSKILNDFIEDEIRKEDVKKLEYVSPNQLKIKL
jgi:antitoxin component of RelBE/YafQ-DinJ toxin-antitoxin module|tara:strand:+ start:585 stop:788 length:204 start_codon:yes stop_codon:yes gene_type:complete